MVPFGSSHPFSCAPQVLTENIGRPPENWIFIRQTIRALLRRWEKQASVGSARANKKRRATSVSHTIPSARTTLESDYKTEPAEQDEVIQDNVDVISSEAADDSDRELQPECTSQEDCQGSMQDILIRHIRDGKPGDVSCKTCWDSFLAQNLALEGQEEPKKNDDLLR